MQNIVRALKIGLINQSRAGRWREGWQIFSVTGQGVNTLGFAGRTISVTYFVSFFVYQPLQKKCENHSQLTGRMKAGCWLDWAVGLLDHGAIKDPGACASRLSGASISLIEMLGEVFAPLDTVLISYLHGGSGRKSNVGW